MGDPRIASTTWQIAKLTAPHNALTKLFTATRHGEEHYVQAEDKLTSTTARSSSKEEIPRCFSR